MESRRIVAIGGAGLEPASAPLQAFVLSLAAAPRPRVCFLPTASGDSERSVALFYRALSSLACRPTDLPLFARADDDLETLLLEQDVIWVGGGNTANMLAVWRVQRLDVVLRRAWEQGIVLCGASAGMICWFTESVTDSFGALAPLHDGLGFLPGSCCPHYDSEVLRRPTFQRLVAAGELRGGWAADDGAALLFEGESMVEVVAARAGASAYRVERTDTGFSEARLPARLLGSPAAPAA